MSVRLLFIAGVLAVGGAGVWALAEQQSVPRQKVLPISGPTGQDAASGCPHERVRVPRFERQEPVALAAAASVQNPPAHTCREAELEAQVAELRDEISQLKSERDALLLQVHPPDTPYGHFLRSPDARVLVDEDARRWVFGVLSDFPLFLKDGEAVWLYDNLAYGGWAHYGDDLTSAVVSLLGYSRVLAELPADRAAALQASLNAGG